MLSHVLTNYPLSSHYKTWLERELGSTPNYISVQELRQRPTGQVVKYLLRLQGGTLLLPLEDGNSAAILPILQLMASLTRIKRIGIITPDKKRIEFRRWQALRAIASFLGASARCISSLRRCDRELDTLAHEEIVVPRVSNKRRVA